MAADRFLILFLSFVLLFGFSSSSRGGFNSYNNVPNQSEVVGRSTEQQKPDEDLKPSASEYGYFSQPYSHGTYYSPYGGQGGYSGYAGYAELGNYGDNQAYFSNGGFVSPTYQPGYHRTNEDYAYSRYGNEYKSYASTGYDTNEAGGTINVGYNLPNGATSYNQFVLITPSINNKHYGGFGGYGNNGHGYSGFQNGYSKFPAYQEPLYDNYRFEQHVYDRRTKCQDVGAQVEADKCCSATTGYIDGTGYEKCCFVQGSSCSSAPYSCCNGLSCQNIGNSQSGVYVCEEKPPISIMHDDPPTKDESKDENGSRIEPSGKGEEEADWDSPVDVDGHSEAENKGEGSMSHETSSNANGQSEPLEPDEEKPAAELATNSFDEKSTGFKEEPTTNQEKTDKSRRDLQELDPTYNDDPFIIDVTEYAKFE